jgi:LuxR family maltose regulon positive regulatory protein
VQRLLGPTADLIRRHPWLRAGGGSGEQPRHGSTDLIRTAALTGKEHEVLEYLAELLTTEEIASTMYVSVNTVRSHVRSVLRKLNASRRNEAVRRAWELGLLPTRPESGNGGTMNADPLRAGPGTQYGSASASSRARTARP